MLVCATAVQVELTAHKEAAATAAAAHQQQLDVLQHEQIAMLTQLASMTRLKGAAGNCSLAAPAAGTPPDAAHG
jgi:hypothetical protein